MYMKSSINKWLLLLAVLVVAELIFLLLSQFSTRTVSVLSESYGSNMNEYYLYVPGDGKSTCTWTYNENGTPQSFTSQPDPQTGQHDFIYDSTVSNTQVSCLNDQGQKYVGEMP